MQIILVAAVFAAICAMRINKLGPELDRTADAYSEANSIRAAEAFLAEGFTAHHGLQRIVYGKRFPDVGSAQSDRFEEKIIPADRNSFVYMHYPPGPDYIIALTALFTGLDNLSLLRTVPAIASLAAMVVLMATISRAMSFKMAGPLSGVVLIAAPIFCRYAVVMHVQCYTTAAMLLAVAVCIHAFWVAPRISRWHIAAMAALGFFQGWMSFDYAFVATLLAVPVWLLARGDNKPVTLRGLIAIIVVSGAAFTFAHALHLAQVAGELGGIGPALAELSGSATYRAGVREIASPEIPHQGYPAFAWSAISSHVHLLLDGFKDAARRETFGFSMVATLLAAALVHMRCTLRPSARAYHLLAIVASIVIALIWSVVMPQHATVHAAFTLRHFLLLYLVAWLSLILLLDAPLARTLGDAPVEARVKP